MIEKLKMIELEINKLCNRKCPWCPNSKIDRSQSERLSMELLIGLLDELHFHHFGEKWYGGFISFSRNNEPFADMDYLNSVIDLIRAYLPYTNLVSNTNGDFLEEALESRINELSIMDYDCKGYEYWMDIMKREYGFKPKLKSGNLMYFEGYDKKIVICLDWPKETLMENRGGFFDGPVAGMEWRSTDRRNIPCHDPEYFVAIDYNGSVMPCCCLRSDYHTEFVLGNLKDNTLEQILTTPHSTDFRLRAADTHMLPKSCEYCHKGIGRYTREFPSIHYSNRYIMGGEEK